MGSFGRRYPIALVYVLHGCFSAPPPFVRIYCQYVSGLGARSRTACGQGAHRRWLRVQSWWLCVCRSRACHQVCGINHDFFVGADRCCCLVHVLCFVRLFSWIIHAKFLLSVNGISFCSRLINAALFAAFSFVMGSAAVRYIHGCRAVRTVPPLMPDGSYFYHPDKNVLQTTLHFLWLLLFFRLCRNGRLNQQTFHKNHGLLCCSTYFLLPR